MEKLTFKEYLDSKDKLREALQNTPQRNAEYTVKKYCKLVIGETKEVKEYVALKPNQTILVEWLYNDLDNPTIVGIRFDGVKNIDPEDDHLTYWDGVKLQKWLLRNTREKI